MGGVAADVETIHPGADFLSVLLRPFEVGGIELDDLVAHLRDGFHRAHEILGQLIADGVKLQADRNLFRGRQKRNCCSREERASRDHVEILTYRTYVKLELW